MKRDYYNRHQEQGYYQLLGETKAFVYEKGEGVPVVCFHGVPTSSYLYRKMIDELADHGYRGISFDILGNGLSDKPIDFDYSWTSLGAWCTELIRALDLDSFHIVLHDIGGPIGTEVIARLRHKVRSVTILNTILSGLSTFRKPFPMHLYERKTVGEVMVKMTSTKTISKLMHQIGVQDREAFSLADAEAYLKFQKYADGGRSFLKIMRSFETTAQKEAFYIHTLRQLEVPKQIIWGKHDPALKLEQYGYPLQKTLGLDALHLVEGRHFIQEDCYKPIVQKIIEMEALHLTSSQKASVPNRL